MYVKYTDRYTHTNLQMKVSISILMGVSPLKRPQLGHNPAVNQHKHHTIQNHRPFRQPGHPRTKPPVLLLFFFCLWISWSHDSSVFPLKKRKKEKRENKKEKRRLFSNPLHPPPPQINYLIKSRLMLGKLAG